MHKRGILVVAAILLIAAASFPVEAMDTENLTLNVNGLDSLHYGNVHYYWGDIIRLSGVANNTSVVYLYLIGGPETTNSNGERLSDCSVIVPGDPSSYDTAPVNAADHTWEYLWDTGVRERCVNRVAAHAYALSISEDPQRHAGKNVYSIWVRQATTPEPTHDPALYTETPKPTPSPAPDYSEEMSALETQVAGHEATLAAHAATLATLAIATEPTPVPTATIDHAATIARLESEIAEQEAKNVEQDSFIDRILAFLGLK